VKTIYYIIILQLLFTGTTAQEPLMPVLTENDSLYNPAIEGQLPHGQLVAEKDLIPGISKIVHPALFNFNKDLTGRWSYSFNRLTFNGWEYGLSEAGLTGFYPLHLPVSGIVLSEGSYKVSDRFSIGGYSFGANHLFSPAPPFPDANNFDFRGSTLFMKYNISKNFRIETRFNVTQGY